MISKSLTACLGGPSLRFHRVMTSISLESQIVRTAAAPDRHGTSRARRATVGPRVDLHVGPDGSQPPPQIPQIIVRPEGRPRRCRVAGPPRAPWRSTAQVDDNEQILILTVTVHEDMISSAGGHYAAVHQKASRSNVRCEGGLSKRSMNQVDEEVPEPPQVRIEDRRYSDAAERVG